MDPIPEKSLALLGTLLAGQNERVGIVIIGGSALLLRGDITRATQDVDIIALVDPSDRSQLIQRGGAACGAPTRCGCRCHRTRPLPRLARQPDDRAVDRRDATRTCDWSHVA